MRTLSDAAAEASRCTRCGLARGRTQVVYGTGHPDADLMFIGEGPGFHEDKQGEPFVGAAGQLLNRMLGEIGLARDQVYIANIVKCRPPGNRDPRPDEIEACTPWLVEQISLILPSVIVTLGNFAFTAADLTIDRGTTVRWRNATPTFHTVTPDGHEAFQEWQTNTQNQTFEFRFDQPGTYRYFCAPHRALGMTGVITVR